MADRRLLEDGSLRLQEDGSYRLLEQQSVIGVTAALVEDDDTLSAGIALAPISEGVPGGASRRRRTPRFRESIADLPPSLIHVAMQVREDDDVLDARIETRPGRKSLQRRRAMAVVMMH